MTIDEQLEQWLKGNSIHNKERDECCPDFSCCDGGDIAPLEVRERFVKAHREHDLETKTQMLLMFLGKALKDEKVYVIGNSPTENGQIH